MTYVPRTDWKDSPDQTTPIFAADLIRIEAGIAAAATSAGLAAVATSGSYADLGNRPGLLTVLSGLNPSAAADNAPAIQAAIDSAASAGGGSIFIPRGTWYTGQLRLKTNVALVGEGWASALKLKPAANAHMFVLDTAQVARASVRDLLLDGNKANQSTTTVDVLHLDNTGYNGTDSTTLYDDDCFHYFVRVAILNAKQHGVYTGGLRGNLQFFSVFVFDAGLNSFRIESPDNQFSHCVSANSGDDGFFFGSNGSATRITGCKSYLSGFTTGSGNGFNHQFITNNDMTHCEAQDNRGHGYVMVGGTACSLINCRADRNGLGPEPVAGGNGDGIFMSSTTDSIISMTSGDRGVGGVYQQSRGYNFGTGNDRNVVTITVGNTKLNQAGVGSAGTNSLVTVTHLGDIPVIPIAPLTKRSISANYTLVAADALNVVLHSTASAAVTVTLPQDSVATIAQEIAIPWRQNAAGQITFAAGAGATLISRGSVFKSASQNAAGTVTKVAANTWLLTGEISA